MVCVFGVVFSETEVYILYIYNLIRFQIRLLSFGSDQRTTTSTYRSPVIFGDLDSFCWYHELVNSTTTRLIVRKTDS